MSDFTLDLIVKSKVEYCIRHHQIDNKIDGDTF